MENLTKIAALQFPTTNYEIGVDEAGRGPIAGDVFAAAVILDSANKIDGLNDSKKLSEKKRNALAEEIKQKALFFAIARANLEEILRLNILWAAMLAMQRAVQSVILQSLEKNDHSQFLVQIDGNKQPDFSGFVKSQQNQNLQLQTQTIVKGDALFANIAAASILAKTARDAEMCELDKQFPQYQFAKHKGYPTPKHLELVKTFGVSPIHRIGFAPIKNLLK